MKSKNSKRLFTTLLVLVLTAGVYFLGFFSFKWTRSDVEKEVLKILDAYDEHYYYKDGDVVDKIVDAIFDQYSEYYTPSEYAELKRKTLGQNTGIGLSFLSGSLVVYGVAVNSPCYNQGVKAGGTLLSATKGETTKFGNDAKELLQSLTQGETVTISVDYSGEVQTFTITKSEYNDSYVTYQSSSGTYVFHEKQSSMQLEKCSNDVIGKSGVGYIKLSSFNGKGEGSYGTASQLKTALLKFKEEGNKKLILDLRNNGGGYMDVASKISGILIQKHQTPQVLSVSEDRNGNRTSHYIGENFYDDYGFEKIVVLANINTASASEMLIGAMLDYDDNNVVQVVIEGYENNGETIYKTFGKGIMQTTYSYRDGSAIKVTTAKVFWPKSNVCIHGVGITENTSEKVVNSSDKNALVYALQII